MEHSKNHGFHIAQKAVSLYPRYLGKDYDFVSPIKSLLFLEQKHAVDYARAIGLELGRAKNVIVPCTCFGFVRDNHQIAE